MRHPAPALQRVLRVLACDEVGHEALALGIGHLGVKPRGGQQRVLALRVQLQDVAQPGDHFAVVELAPGQAEAGLHVVGLQVQVQHLGQRHRVVERHEARSGHAGGTAQRLRAGFGHAAPQRQRDLAREQHGEHGRHARGRAPCGAAAA
jgi:hypothetical protein